MPIPFSGEQTLIHKINITKLFAIYIKFSFKKYLDQLNYEFKPLLFIFIESLLHARFCAGLISIYTLFYFSTRIFFYFFTQIMPSIFLLKNLSEIFSQLKKISCENIQRDIIPLNALALYFLEKSIAVVEWCFL